MVRGPFLVAAAAGGVSHRRDRDDIGGMGAMADGAAPTTHPLPAPSLEPCRRPDGHRRRSSPGVDPGLRRDSPRTAGLYPLPPGDAPALRAAGGGGADYAGRADAHPKFEVRGSRFKVRSSKFGVRGPRFRSTARPTRSLPPRHLHLPRCLLPGPARPLAGDSAGLLRPGHRAVGGGQVYPPALHQRPRAPHQRGAVRWTGGGGRTGHAHHRTPAIGPTGGLCLSGP